MSNVQNLKVVIVGAGQIGLSAALGAQRGNFSTNMTVFDINSDHIRQWEARASTFGVSETLRGTSDTGAFESALRQADFVLLATPVDAFAGVTKQIAPHLKEDAILTDVGSVKEPFVSQIAAALKEAGRTDVHFWWSHPGTGSAISGPQGAKEYMFRNASVFVEDGDMSNPHFQTLLRFWTCQGARIEQTNSHQHDRVFGFTSHLTHLLAFSLMSHGRNESGQLLESFRQAGTTLCNATRIATASDKMWVPILMGNRQVIEQAAELFCQKMESLLGSIQNGKGPVCERELAFAQEFRLTLAEKDRSGVSPLFREGVRGDIEDLLERNANDLTACEVLTLLREAGKDEAFTRTVLVPFLIAVADIHVNAEKDKELSMDLARTANPSILDLTAPALNDPVFMASLLGAHRDSVLSHARAFLGQVRRVVEGIRRGDEASLTSLITTGREHRLAMPLPRRLENATAHDRGVRVQFVIGG